MKSRKSASVRTRLLWYFFGAILAPCIVLLILAYQGIANDKAARTQTNRELLRLSAADAISECEMGLVKEMQIFGKWIKGYDIDNAGPVYFTDSTLLTYLVEKELISNVATVEPSGLILLHAPGLLYLQDGTLPSDKRPVKISHNTVLEHGLAIEYQDKDLVRATLYYTNALREAALTTERCDLELAVYRVLKKRGLYSQALKFLEDMKLDCAGSALSGQVPYGILIPLERARLYLLLADTISAVVSLEVGYALLSDGPVVIEESTYEFALLMLDEMFGKVMQSSVAEVQALCVAIQLVREEIDIRAGETELQLEFIKEGTTAGMLDDELKSRLVALSSVILPTTGMIEVVAGVDGRSWVLFIDRRAVLGKLEDLIDAVVAGYEDSGWKIYDENNRIIGASDTIVSAPDPVFANMEYGGSRWRVELWTAPVGFLSTKGGSGRGLYVLILLIISTTLIFGIVFTLRAINTEMRLARLQSDFISTVSHEFRSPLTSIRHLVELLHEGKVTSESRRKQYFKVILEQGEKLSHVVENLLDFASHEDGENRLVMEHTDIGIFLTDLAQEFNSRVDNEGFTLNLDIAKDIHALRIDRQSLYRAIINLLDNAHKYSAGSNRAELRALNQDSMVHIYVSDHGQGIARADLPHIFDRFYRSGDTLTRSVKGTGIGLALVKRTVQAHGGEVIVESVLGEGSTFEVILPVT